MLEWLLPPVVRKKWTLGMSELRLSATADTGRSTVGHRAIRAQGLGRGGEDVGYGLRRGRIDSKV
jgi:hypothetical protein